MANQLKRLTIPRAYEAVHRALEEEILSGRIATGAPLPTETELAEQFGVTRHTVREGMRALEQGGLVRREAGRRLHAALPHHEELAPRGSRALLMQGVTFRELWEVALRLEICAAELVAPLVDEALIEKLEANLGAMQTAQAEGRSIIALDVAFHALIAEATHNRVLLMSREPVSLLFYPSLEKLFSHPTTRERSPRRIVEAHRAIVQAMRAGDAQALRGWMERHIMDFRRGYDLAGIDLDRPVDVKIDRS
ncbi:MAG: FCD domain-containing protein [Candidatus Brevundimonas phytovorans]|nr:FCD domain-containing protein [Brevundimonas sp.]WEK58164.1 MAG: FCD domain-containing protein [Brevundimonas sp.]